MNKKIAPENGKIKWPKDTAGHSMTTKIPRASREDTVASVLEKLHKNAGEIDTVNYIYVVDAEERLIGIVSIKDILRLSPTTRIWEIAKKTSLVSVHPETDQERAVYLALKNNIKAIPVLDEKHELLGVLPSDTILSILHRETHEDAMHRIGIHHRSAHHENILEDSTNVALGISFLHRIPWLFIGLLGGIVMARIIGVFEKTIEQNVILAGFIPLIVYMSSAVGMQTATFLIRDMALGNKIPMMRYCLRQIAITGMMAILFGAIFFYISYLFYGGPGIASTLATALGSAIIASVISGLVIPLTLNKCKMDPASATGPLGTMVQDIVSIIIYFSFASWLL